MTAGVAVAVSARMFGWPSGPVAEPISRKAGRKSCPHWRDAVRLVDHEQADRMRRQRSDEVGIGESLRRREDDPRAAFGDRQLGRGDLGGAQCAVQLDRRNAELVELVALVLHQRDQRRDDHRDPGQQGRRQLVAQRLACAGRHRRERRPAGQHVGDDRFLAFAQGPDPEGPAQRALDRCAIDPGCGILLAGAAADGGRLDRRFFRRGGVRFR